MEKVRPWCGQPSDRGRLRNSPYNSSTLTIFVSKAWLRKYLCEAAVGAVLEMRVRGTVMSLSVAEFRQITRSHRRTTHCRRPMSLHRRHRIDEHLDTLLANRPISDGEATDHCQKVTPQDGGLPELIVARSWFHCRYCPCGLHTRTHTQSAAGVKLGRGSHRISDPALLV